MLSVNVPFPFFTESDGSPLDNGNIYFGTVNLNPETSPIQVYADEAGTIPLAQPIKTSNGYMVRYGAPVNVFVNSAYSITVKNKNNELVYTLPSSAINSTSGGSSNIIIDLGAVPNDPAVDNADIFNDAFSQSDNAIALPAGRYNVDSLIVIDCDNLEVYGVEGATIITSANLVELAQIVRMENVNFYGITFELTTVSGIPSRGVVFGDDPLITNSSFVRCSQTSPNCTAGAFMIDGAGTINNFDLTDNIIFDVGGKGIYFSATEYKNVIVSGGVVKNTGSYPLESGDGVTFAEGGSQSTVDGVAFSNTFGACIKLDSVSDIFVMNNRFFDLSRICNVIDSDNTSARNASITYFNNETVGRVFDGAVNIVSHDNPQMSQNRWYLTSAFHVTDTLHLKASGDIIDSTAVNAIRVDGTSENNEWIGGLITNADAADNVLNVTVQNDGASVFSTRLVSVELYKTSLGSLASGTTGAPSPDIISCSGDAGGGSGIVTYGLKVITGLQVTNNIDVGTVSVALDPPSATDFSPYILQVNVVAYDPSLNVFFADTQLVYLEARNSAALSSCLLLGGFNPIVSADVAGAGFTIQFPWAGTSGLDVDYVFDISITGQGVPTITAA